VPSSTCNGVLDNSLASWSAACSKLNNRGRDLSFRPPIRTSIEWPVNCMLADSNSPNGFAVDRCVAVNHAFHPNLLYSLRCGGLPLRSIKPIIPSTDRLNGICGFRFCRSAPACDMPCRSGSFLVPTDVFNIALSLMDLRVQDSGPQATRGTSPCQQNVQPRCKHSVIRRVGNLFECTIETLDPQKNTSLEKNRVLGVGLEYKPGCQTYTIDDGHLSSLVKRMPHLGHFLYALFLNFHT